MTKKILIIFSIAILYSCATVQGPTGGEKDKLAPILYESTPKHQSTNFDGLEIRLFFNEWMKLDQLDKELIITPREEIKYEATLKKQELLIELEEPLKDSTTYTFNFRKALKDITEGNLWADPVIAFSTGPYLDSLEISGQVSSIKDNQPKEAFIVGLYSASYDTANLREGKPVYFTTTDQDGKFQMKNLKNGDYKLYTFQDKNDDLINNSRSEPFGFHPEIISLYDSIPPLNLETYSRNEDTLKLKKYGPVGKDFIVQYNKGLEFYSITNPKDSSQYIYANDIEDSKYIKIYKENFPSLEFENDSSLLLISVQDSIGSSKTDSVYFRLRESRITNDTIKIVQKPKGSIISGPQEFHVGLSKPVRLINHDSIQLRIDSIPIHTFSTSEIKTNFNKKLLTINKIITADKINALADSLAAINQQPNSDSTRNVNNKTVTNLDTSKNQEEDRTETLDSENMLGRNQMQKKPANSAKLNLFFGKSAFMGIENDSSQEFEVAIDFRKIEDNGIIKGQVIEPNSPFVIQLLDEQYKVMDTLINQKEYVFKYVKPGKYRLRLLIDENGNGTWDPGNVYDLKEAEKFVFYDELITVKANWEVIEKDFDFTVDKSVDKSVQTNDL